MRTVAIIMAVIIVSVMVCGCTGMSEEDRAMIRTLRNEEAKIWTEKAEALSDLAAKKKALYESYRAKMTELEAGVRDGSITLADSQAFGMALARDWKETKEEILEEKTDINDMYDRTKERIEDRVKDLQDRGYSGMAIFLEFVRALIGGGLGFASANAYRNRRHPLTTEI